MSGMAPRVAPRPPEAFGLTAEEMAAQVDLADEILAEIVADEAALGKVCSNASGGGPMTADEMAEIVRDEMARLQAGRDVATERLSDEMRERLRRRLFDAVDDGRPLSTDRDMTIACAALEAVNNLAIRLGLVPAPGGCESLASLPVRGADDPRPRGEVEAQAGSYERGLTDGAAEERAVCVRIARGFGAEAVAAKIEERGQP